MKSEILTRYDKWELAVKDARQRANNAKLVIDGNIGKIITDSILHDALPI
jgi:DNA-directed RNA polymerase subunit K/omega